MIVYKNYFKIIKANIRTLLMYLAIFLALVFMSAQFGRPVGEYNKTKVPIYVKDESNSEISKAVLEFIDENQELVDVKADLVKDNLFYEKIVAAITIPKDFEKTRVLEFEQNPKSSFSLYGKQEINQFLNQIGSYENAGFSTTEAITKTNEDFKKGINVEIKRNNGDEKRNLNPYYFSFLGYVLMSQLILVVGTINLVYNDLDTLKRNIISPYKKKRIDLELILGHITAGLLIWAVYMITYMIIFKDFTLDKGLILMMLNALIFAVSIICFAVFVSKIAKDGNTISGIMNVFSLGASFLSGIFVPQEILGDTALAIGRFFPSFYYVRNIAAIRIGENPANIRNNFLIMLGFSLIFIILTTLIKIDISKIKSREK